MAKKKQQTKQVEEVKPPVVELESVMPELEPVLIDPTNVDLSTDLINELVEKRVAELEAERMQSEPVKEEVPFAEKIKTIGMGTKPKTGSKTLPNGTTIKYN